MGWIIAGAVLVVILVLLLCNVTVIFDYGGEVYLRISYLFFTIVRVPAKRKKTRRKDRKAKKVVKAAAEDGETARADAAEKGDAEKEKPAEKGDKTPEKSPKSEKDDKEKKSLGDIFEVVKLVLDSLGKPLKKLLKRTRISHFYLDIVCGGEDAAKAALTYGGANILVGNALGWIDGYFTLKPVDGLNIGVDFQRERTTAECHAEARLTLIAALAFVFTLLGRALRFYRAHGEAKSAVDKFIKK
ncbi:MAG: DUF2953 domain-containing protein [Lachnospiraceae bacterium]|nr:DUF2953 domain-containing protein [Ruminococcus sp.]MCM1274204.1 DUF2953 domain-containing protein [Lachnospiraceae bacterium]